MKKLLAILLTFLNLGAHAESSLKEIVDDLNYSLSVEWDQKDSQFLKDQISKFESKLSEQNIIKSDLSVFFS